MYPFYFEQFPTTSTTMAYQPQWSIDDYIQLQYLARQEQIRREQQIAALQAYREKQQEQLRLQKALYQLQVMAEIRHKQQQQRQRQREAAIQAYYEEKRRQQEEEEERRRIALRRYQSFYDSMYSQPELIFCNLEYEKPSPVAYPSPMDLMEEDDTTLSSDSDSEIETEAEAEAENELQHQPVVNNNNNNNNEQLESLIKLIFGQQEETTTEAKQTQHEDYPSNEEKNDQQQDHFSTTEHGLLNDDYEEEEDESHYYRMSENPSSPLELNHQENNDMAYEGHEEECISMTMEEMPELVDDMTGSIQNLMGPMSTHDNNKEEFTEFPKEDPIKLSKFEMLGQIEQELDEIRQKHEDHILQASLDFSPSEINRPHSPVTLNASTLENREFLGYEDMIMKLLLKLDTIESEGDEEIRNERKSLVKRAESMLERLDEYKQREWERASVSSNSSNGSHSDEEN
ncbi:uncharacterized protein BX663DRAFT_500386 [Cokeromyces recurvatus]|uniref:uncharacterized protein n=1 Tax=Cokeromyces recurvatus TaxID=90255 RepID=UPI00221F6174|nr:uncharacterized protein BX663DRAFT_500386 [Cokeromyces recurvatus]KAI7905629.1 hypothetical protein BX663DRAFT_500386 [Cokeromyces recurvatus]